MKESDFFQGRASLNGSGFPIAYNSANTPPSPPVLPMWLVNFG